VSLPGVLPAGVLPPLVVVGASTGGPEALRKVLAGLPNPLSYALIAVQHLGEIFVPGLAVWLAKETGLNVSVVTPSQKPIAGHVYIACTSDHLILNASGNMAYVRQPETCIHRPSVDVFFVSLLAAPVTPGTAVLLTGMGSDGAEGLKSLCGAGWETIAQDEASSVVWGMPRAAARIGAVKQVLPVDQIGAAIGRSMQKGLS
jgi:two-component system response regulator WspF